MFHVKRVRRANIHQPSPDEMGRLRACVVATAEALDRLSVGVATCADQRSLIGRVQSPRVPGRGIPEGGVGNDGSCGGVSGGGSVAGDEAVSARRIVPPAGQKRPFFWAMARADPVLLATTGSDTVTDRLRSGRDVVGIATRWGRREHGGLPGGPARFTCRESPVDGACGRLLESPPEWARRCPRRLDSPCAAMQISRSSPCGHSARCPQDTGVALLCRHRPTTVGGSSRDVPRETSRRHLSVSQLCSLCR